jgi:alpha-N-arabinofuranosidase
MNRLFLSQTFLISVLFAAWAASAAEFHVATTGNDGNAGSAVAPLRTISAAAQRAQAGDTITVHAGVYRERVSPPRGGQSDAKRIIYRAAPGERVTIKGSEIVKGWSKVQGEVWKLTLPNTFFGGFNPYRDVIHGDWFDGKGRTHHTGAVYLNGDWQAWTSREAKIKPTSGVKTLCLAFKSPPPDPQFASTLNPQLWLAHVDATNTVIWARFKGIDPNREVVEINVRPTVFTPERAGIDYITVRGFDLRHAAAPWAPPTAGQIGVI